MQKTIFKKLLFITFLIFVLIPNLYSNELIVNSKNTEVKYSLKMEIDYNDLLLISQLKNESPFEIKLREDALPLSFLLMGADFSAYVDDEVLKRTDVFYHIGSSPRYVEIKSGETITSKRKLKAIIPDYCSIIMSHNILLHWRYHADNNNYYLKNKDGLLRIKKGDGSCKK